MTISLRLAGRLCAAAALTVALGAQSKPPSMEVDAGTPGPFVRPASTLSHVAWDLRTVTSAPARLFSMSVSFSRLPVTPTLTYSLSQ